MGELEKAIRDSVGLSFDDCLVEYILNDHQLRIIDCDHQPNNFVYVWKEKDCLPQAGVASLQWAKQYLKVKPKPIYLYIYRHEDGTYHTGLNKDLSTPLSPLYKFLFTTKITGDKYEIVDAT